MIATFLAQAPEPPSTSAFHNMLQLYTEIIPPYQQELEQIYWSPLFLSKFPIDPALKEEASRGAGFFFLGKKNKGHPLDNKKMTFFV